MSRNQGIFLSVNKADLLMSMHLLHALADIHPRYLKSCQTFYFAGNTCKYARKHAVKKTTASSRQKLRTRFLAESGKIRVG
jgi:hypothetical protein